MFGKLVDADKFWKVNQQFLDDAIDWGDEIIVINRDLAMPDSNFKDELDYLARRGYKNIREITIPRE